MSLRKIEVFLGATLLVLFVWSAIGVQTVSAASTRDWRTWPFSQLSPWNHPIGSGAVYVNPPSSIDSMGIQVDNWTASVAIATSSDPVITLYYEWGRVWPFLDGGGNTCNNSRADELYLLGNASIVST